MLAQVSDVLQALVKLNPGKAGGIDILHYLEKGAPKTLPLFFTNPSNDFIPANLSGKQFTILLMTESKRKLMK